MLASFVPFEKLGSTALSTFFGRQNCEAIVSRSRWINAMGVSPISYVCGFCDHFVSSSQGYVSENPLPSSLFPGKISICPQCEKPTFIHGTQILPECRPGSSVANVPDSVDRLYNEARACISVSAFTASVLISRKVLMNLAVSNGASQGQNFISYVEFLADRGYVPPNGKDWVDHIRKKGNEATHEIADMTSEDAKDLVSFLEMLLKFMFEFPARVPRKPSA
jgi:Domain of unknown function (DUF4145)